MADFKVILDDFGIETASAWWGASRVWFIDANQRTHKYGAVAVEAISVESTTSGTLKGAAWGLVLAGPLGVAVGSMVGGGMKVAFELQTLEGPVLKCIAGKGAYLKLKKRVETRPAQPPGVRHEPTGPREIGCLLMGGLVLLPVVFYWPLLGRRHTARARFVGLAWLILWCLVFALTPDAPSSPPPSSATAAAAPAVPAA